MNVLGGVFAPVTSTVTRDEVLAALNSPSKAVGSRGTRGPR